MLTFVLKKEAMRNMVKIIGCCIVAALLLVSCSSVTSGDPNTVLQEFFEHLAKKDIDGAAKYVTSDSKPTMQMMKKGLDMAEKMKDSLPQSDPMKDFQDVVIEPARVMGDSALITVKSRSGQRPDAEFKLLKESNGWKVDFTMSTLMRMGRQSIQSQGHEIGDSIAANSNEIHKGMEMADSVLKNIDPKMLDDIQKKLENLK
jgi:PBP1b-binding outer membrane lipoprotein LpoB